MQEAADWLDRLIVGNQRPSNNHIRTERCFCVSCFVAWGVDNGKVCWFCGEVRDRVGVTWMDVGVALKEKKGWDSWMAG